jgi:hypothetical protein
MRKDFDIYRNIVYWSSIKCKWVTRSILVSELYGMITRFNSSMVLSIILN